MKPLCVCTYVKDVYCFCSDFSNKKRPSIWNLTSKQNFLYRPCSSFTSSAKSHCWNAYYALLQHKCGAVAPLSDMILGFILTSH